VGRGASSVIAAGTGVTGPAGWSIDVCSACVLAATFWFASVSDACVVCTV